MKMQRVTPQQLYIELLIKHGIDKYPRPIKGGGVRYSVYNPIKREAVTYERDGAYVAEKIGEIYA